MHSDLEQISFPTFGKKASFFWIHLSSLCSTNIDLSTCAILIQGEMTCTWKCAFLKWLHIEVEVANFDEDVLL